MLFGHQTSARRLKQAYDTQHLHHALIFSGPEGVGKETLAHHLINYARSYPTGNTQHEDLSAVKDYKETGHPNVFVIKPVFDEKKQRYKRDITLDALDGLTKFLRLAPQSDAPRFIVIKPADGMNIQTQNALLKMLEEPPVRTHFLLLTTQIGSLLPTIRSRCLTLTLDALALPEFTSGVQTILPHIDDHKIPELYNLSEGALGQAIQNEKLNLLGIYSAMCSALVAWHEDKDSRPAMQLAEELARNGNELTVDKIMQIALSRLAVMVKATASEQPINFIIAEEQRLIAVWQKSSLSRLLQWHETLLIQWQNAEDAYLDKKIFLMQIFSTLSSIDS